MLDTDSVVSKSGPVIVIITSTRVSYYGGIVLSLTYVLPLLDYSNNRLSH